MRPKAMYWQHRSKKCGKYHGPVDIHDDVHIVMRFLSIKHDSVDLTRICSNLKQIDTLYHILNMSGDITNYHARVKMTTGIRTFALVLGHRIPKAL
eukprot:10531074-Karenia_brevis.AAC.1